MREWTTLGALTFVVVLAGGCGGGVATTPSPAPSPTPSPVPSPAVNAIEFGGSEPSLGGTVHTGLPDPAGSRAGGVTTGLLMTFMVSSAVDRTARLQVVLSGPQNGVCLMNGMPLGVPGAPAFELRAGFSRAVTINQLLLTSVCGYPNLVTQATARLLPGSPADPDQTPYYETTFALQYTIVE